MPPVVAAASSIMEGDKQKNTWRLIKKKIISVDIYRSTSWCLFVTFAILCISISLGEPKLNPKSCCQENLGNVVPSFLTPENKARRRRRYKECRVPAQSTSTVQPWTAQALCPWACGVISKTDVIQNYTYHKKTVCKVTVIQNSKPLCPFSSTGKSSYDHRNPKHFLKEKWKKN